MRQDRARRLTALAVLVAGFSVCVGCGGGSLGGEDEVERSGPVKIGLLLPRSGVYKALGDDMKNGFELYVELNQGKLGGRDVELVVADEGETPETGQAAAEKLVKRDQVLAATGVVSSAVMNAVHGLFESSEVPLVGSNASPTTLTDVNYIWRTSYLNDEPGEALGEYVAENVDGAVYLIAAGYQAGEDEIAGFRETFDPAGGQVADTTYTPFPQTRNFQPFLSRVQKSGAESVFTFYAGSAAVDFVKQYSQFGLAERLPLYAPGFLTEGGVLQAQGDAALGIFTSMNYSADLDNAANRRFVEAYEGRYGAAPTTYAMASYDAAQVLDKAIADAGDELTSESLNEAIGRVGEIDSPRGSWRFNEIGTPIQTWYLREVREVDGELSNQVVEELGTLGEQG